MSEMILDIKWSWQAAIMTMATRILDPTDMLNLSQAGTLPIL